MAGWVPRAFCLCLGKKLSNHCKLELRFLLLSSSPQLIWGGRRGSFDNGRRGRCQVREYLSWASLLPTLNIPIKRFPKLWWQGAQHLPRQISSLSQSQTCYGSHPLVLVTPSGAIQASRTLLSIILLLVSDESNNNNNSKHLHVMLCAGQSSKCFT